MNIGLPSKHSNNTACEPQVVFLVENWAKYRQTIWGLFRLIKNQYKTYSTHCLTLLNPKYFKFA